MESLRHDVRLALRLMAAHKMFSAAVLVTLVLGIGANTAMFSIVYGVLLRPLPYYESDQLCASSRSILAAHRWCRTRC